MATLDTIGLQIGGAGLVATGGTDASTELPVVVGAADPGGLGVDGSVATD